MPAMIDSSRTSTTSSSTTSRSSRTSGIGQRPATPSAIVSMLSVWTTVPRRQDNAIAGEADLSAEGGDLPQLERVGGPPGHDGDLHASTRAAVGQRLTEVPGARAHYA